MQQILVALAIVVMGAPEQQRPDFSGEWILESPPGGPEVPGALSVQHTFSRPPMNPPTAVFLEQFRVEREYDSGRRIADYRVGMTGGIVGGVARDSSQPTTRTTQSVSWRGDRLVIEAGTYSGPLSDPGPYTEREEVWSLDLNGRLVIIMTDRASGRDDTSTRLTYRRR